MMCRGASGPSGRCFACWTRYPSIIVSPIAAVETHLGVIVASIAMRQPSTITEGEHLSPPMAGVYRYRRGWRPRRCDFGFSVHASHSGTGAPPSSHSPCSHAPPHTPRPHIIHHPHHLPGSHLPTSHTPYSPLGILLIHPHMCHPCMTLTPATNHPLALPHKPPSRPASPPSLSPCLAPHLSPVDTILACRHHTRL